MDILGIGFPELILIFLIALMVFGPRRLPELAAKVGKTVADLRNMSSGLLTEWQREIAVATRVEELEKTRQEFDQIKQEIKQARGEIASEASNQVKELKDTQKELKEAKQETQQVLKESSSEKLSEIENTIKPSSAPPHSAPPAEVVSE